jgi:hypothetical protein
MKIRTSEDLVDVISEDFSWRKQELSLILHIIYSSKGKDTQLRSLIRCGITVLYAHWEGFIKLVSTSYLEFISRQGLLYKDLAIPFIAIGTKSIIPSILDTNKATIYVKAVEFILNCKTDKCEIPWDKTINTRSNLNSSVLKEIITLLNLDYLPFQTKEILIDHRLLYYRNNIAHGKGLYPNIDDFDDLYHQIIALMEEFRTQTENAAILKQYLRKSVV